MGVRSRIPDEDLLEALREAAAELGEPMAATAYRALRRTRRDLPSDLTIINRFDGWSAACAAVGLAVNSPRRRAPRGCAVAGCERPHYARGWCRTHYLREGGPPPPPKDGYIDPRGYRFLTRDGRRVLEHRYVMEQTLGRELLPGESVHHRNGVRADNRPENLELRVGSHGQGLTPEDAVAWAREILARYG